jgi:hypothetical protein
MNLRVQRSTCSISPMDHTLIEISPHRAPKRAFRCYLPMHVWVSSVETSLEFTDQNGLLARHFVTTALEERQ